MRHINIFLKNMIKEKLATFNLIYGYSRTFYLFSVAHTSLLYSMTCNIDR